MSKLAIVLLTIAGTVHGAPFLFTIGADGLGVPNQLVQIDLTALTQTSLGVLGSGSESFAGGLVYQSGVFRGFRGDAFGNQDLVTFSGPGAVSLLLDLPNAFQPGGLTAYGAHLAWVENDAFGGSKLNTTDGLTMDLGQGFTGGLTYRPDDGLFYAIRNDSFGNSTLHSLNLGTGMVTELFGLGQGFYGGLAWSASDGQFYATRSDVNAIATLVPFSPSGATGPSFELGPGFLFAALAVASPPVSPPAVPEPGTFVLVGAGILAVALRFGRR